MLMDYSINEKKKIIFQIIQMSIMIFKTYYFKKKSSIYTNDNPLINHFSLIHNLAKIKGFYISFL